MMGGCQGLGYKPHADCPVLLQPVVAPSVGRGILPSCIPGGPKAGNTAPTVWTSGVKESAGLGEVAGCAAVAGANLMGLSWLCLHRIRVRSGPEVPAML